MNYSLESKRNHHFLPRLYLKGFVEDKKEPFVWVYEKGKDYRPGTKRHNNPQKRPISRVGAERDHYAYKRRDGSIDFDKYENELEKLEKPSDPIFQKLRDHKMITKQEKEIFAPYIFHLFKRVPKRIERLQENWSEIYASVSSDILNWLNLEESKIPKEDLARLTKISGLRNEAEDVLEFYKENFFDSEIPLKSMVQESTLGIPQILSKMTWQFYVAPTGHGYVAGDNPIFNPGLNKSYTEISFPISKDVALIISWYNIEQGFFQATPEMVMEINQRTASNAQHELYYSSAESWIVDLFKEKRDGYYLIYPYPVSMFS